MRIDAEILFKPEGDGVMAYRADTNPDAVHWPRWADPPAFGFGPTEEAAKRNLLDNEELRSVE